MPVEQVPGFWDYLGQGIQRGVEMHRQNEAIAREEAHKKTAEAQANAGLIGQLFQSGAVDSTALQGALTGAGVQGAPVIASKAERRRNILAQGQPAIDALSDEEKKDLGFTSDVQKATEKAQITGAGLEAKKGELLTKYLGGGQLSDQEAAGVGVMGAKDLELKRVSQLDPYLGGVGERYVAGQLLKNNGRIDPSSAQQVAENAYSQYVAERATNGLGALTPEQVAYTRQYFSRATENALIAQRKQDLEEYAAKTGRIHAEAAKNQAGQNTSLQWFGKVNTAMENVRKSMDDITKKNPAVLYALDNPALAQSPIVKGAIAEYQKHQATLEAFRSAQGALAQGQIPGNLADILSAADAVTTRGAGPAVAGAGTGAAPGGAGGAPPGGTSPAGGGRAGPSASGAPAAPDPLAGTVNMIVQGKATLENAKDLMTRGTITAAQYAEIERRVKTSKGGKK